MTYRYVGPMPTPSLVFSMYVTFLPRSIMILFLRWFPLRMKCYRSSIAILKDSRPHFLIGNRIVKFLLSNGVARFVRIAEHSCCVWYAGQSLRCYSCRSSGHWALRGLCRRWRKPSHVARKCRQAWARLSLLLLLLLFMYASIQRLL